MSKGEFMKELERLLSKVPENEKRDALDYYNDYFAEAGITEDMLVPASMGTPEHIADTIINDTVYIEKNTSSVKQEYTENGYFNTISDNLENGVTKAGKNKNSNSNFQNNTNENSGYYYERGTDENSKEFKGTSTNTATNDNTKLIIAIVLLVVFSPAIIGAVSGIGGTIIGVFVALVALVIGFIAGGVAIIIVAFLTSEIAGGILLAGTGLLLIGLGLVSVVLLTMYCGQFLPWLVNQCMELIQWILGKKDKIL